MYKNHKIIVVTPSGRRQTQKILFEYILKNIKIIDEYRIWLNTTNIQDTEWLNNLSQQYKFVSIDSRIKKNGTTNINQYFDKTIEDNIYIRLDDDIIYLHDSFFTELIEFRINNPQYFLVFGNIVNNGICSYIHQNREAFKSKINIEYGCMKNLWNKGEIAYNVHASFLNSLENELYNYNKYCFDKYVLQNYERFSINAIAWFGKDMQRLTKGKIIGDEEEFLTVNISSKNKIYNCICGKALCAHYSYCTQKEFLDKTDILKRYHDFAFFPKQTKISQEGS